MMGRMRSLDPETLASYRSPRYVVHTGADDLTLALDVPNPGLGGLPRGHGAAGGCLATARNPCCQARTPPPHPAAPADLRAWRGERGWPPLDGWGSCAGRG